jgi:hypothetical protein
MKLSYECHLDPAKMPTMQGKKFCDSCQKQVHDLRRKTDAKILQFYQENPTACVIAYDDQLAKLPAKASFPSSRNYLPYAAVVLAAAMLPTLTMAQQTSRAEAPPAAIVPIVIPDIQATTVNAAPNSPKNYSKYFIKGKVKLHDKKYRTRAGREITFYVEKHSPEGKFLGTDTLATGKVGLTGKFRLKTTEEYFRIIQDSASQIHMNVRIKGLYGASFRDVKVEGNKVSGIVHIRRRVRWVGKF